MTAQNQHQALAELYRDWRRHHEPRRQGTHLLNRQEALCRSCHGYIIWVRTENGKMMPLEPGEDPEGRFIFTRYVDSGGRRIVHWVKDHELEEYLEPRYESHYGTCPAKQERDNKTEEEKFL